MTDLSHAWQAYHQGDFSRAAHLFDHSSEEASIVGEALARYEMGQADDAVDLVRQRLQQQPSLQLEALLADLLGRQRQRAEAEQILAQVTSRDDDHGFYRSLLGEQRIRQGKWKEGTDDFIAGLNKPANRAFPHVRRVVADMVDAIMARRIPRQDAMKFINRIDYSTSNKTQEMDRFFAKARRDVNANRRMGRDDIHEPWAVLLGGAPGEAPSPPPSKPSAPTGRPSSGQGRAPRSSGPPPTRTPDRSPSPSKQKRRARADRARRRKEEIKRRAASSEQRKRDQRQTKNQQRLSERPKILQPQQQPAIDSQQKDMTAVMQQERRRNEALQDLISELAPPIWPSEFDEPIDVIQPIGFSDRALLPGSQDIETANFRITQGAINVEITLERCMHNLVAAASAATPTTLPLTKESISRLELNLLDDFLEAMPRLEELYRDETEVDDSRPMAVGKFIGECIVQSYGGVWEHTVPARDSVIHLGDHTLDPMGLADEFFRAPDFDSVSLRSLLAAARKAVRTSTAFPRFADYIDPTSGLETEALVMNLAELWVGYRFVLPDTVVPDVVASVEIHENADEYITFKLDADLVPPRIIEENDGAVDTGGNVHLAYVRDSGEFLLLGSRKHFRRFMAVTQLPVRDDSASKIAGYIRDFFRPAWNVITSRKAAHKWQKKYDTSSLKPPGIRKRSGEVTLRLRAVDTSNSIRTIDLTHRPSHSPPYAMSVE